MADRQIYVVVSQTGTILSRILKIFTRARYNHASVSYDGTLETMYSFGRLNAYNPFFAGFVSIKDKYNFFGIPCKQIGLI